MANTTNTAATGEFDLVATAKEAAENSDWAAKYQPSTIDGLILPSAMKASLAKIAKSPEPNSIQNLLLHGPTGTGKSATIEAIIKESGLSRFYLNGAKQGDADTIRKTLGRLTAVNWTSRSRGVFFDEFDDFSAQSFALLKGDVLKDYRIVNVFFAAANNPAKIPDPIKSRFTCIDLGAEIKKERKSLIHLHVERAAEILNAEGVQYDRTVVANIIEARFPDMRSWIGELQFRAIGGPIDKL